MRFADRRLRSFTAAAASLALVWLVGMGTAHGAPRSAGAILAQSKQRVGYVTAVKNRSVRLQQRKLDPEGTPFGDEHVADLHAGDQVRATERGKVWFEVHRGKQGGAYCTMHRRGGPGRVRVAPPRTKRLLDFTSGRLQCSTSRSGAKKTIKVKHVTIETVDPVFQIDVEKKRVVIKLRGGSAEVTGSKGKGVVVAQPRGRPSRVAQQVVVPSGGAPGPPKEIKLTTLEGSAFGKLVATQPPPLPDREPPRTTLTERPQNPSDATVTFRFKADETEALFSCSLDGGDYYSCESPYQLSPPLNPTTHTFSVRATDKAGNTGDPASYKWLVVTSAPSGIVFASFRSGNGDIYSMRPNGSGLTRLTTDTALDDDPEWSLDGTKIVFHSDRDGKSEIYVMDADGRNQRRLTTNPAVDRNPTWSPDGTRIAFESFRDDGQTREIYVMNADGSGQTRLTFNAVADLDPAWSPDGETIAFARGPDGERELHLMNPNGSNPRQVGSGLADAFNPAWSPDSKRLAFHSRRDGNFEISVMDADGSNLKRLTTDPENDFNPTWSPTGSQIAFQSKRDNNFEIYVMESDSGAAQTRLTFDAADDQVPNW